MPIPAQPQFSSSWTMQPVSTSVDAAAADLLGQHVRGQPDLGRPVHDSSGQYVSRSSTSAATGRISRARELARERLDLALLVGQVGGVGASSAMPASVRREPLAASQEPSETA